MSEFAAQTGFTQTLARADHIDACMQELSASRALRQLMERKILTEPKQRSNRVFRAAEILARLERE